MLQYADHPFNQRLQAEIDDLASQHTDAPHFAPHVTLLGGIEGSESEVLKKAEELSKQLSVRNGAANVFL